MALARKRGERVQRGRPVGAASRSFVRALVIALALAVGTPTAEARAAKDAPAPPPAPTAEQLIADYVRDYVRGDVAARRAILAALAPHDAIERGSIQRWLKAIQGELRKLPRHDGAPVSKLQHPDFPLSYRLIKKRDGRDLSLLILLHSGGNDKATNDRTWRELERHRGAPYDIIVMPRVWDDTTGAGWAMDSAAVSVEALLLDSPRSASARPATPGGRSHSATCSTCRSPSTSGSSTPTPTASDPRGRSGA